MIKHLLFCLLLTFPMKCSLVSGDYRIRLLVPYAVSGGYRAACSTSPDMKLPLFFF